METKGSPTCPFTVTVRRNPHRKARPTTTSTKCREISLVSSSSTVPEVPSFPIEEILSMEVPKNPKSNSNSASENLRVFLRIRPLLPLKISVKDQNPKSRAKNVWPQNPSKKKDKATNKKNSSNVCVVVNDCHSVTLSPPLTLQESKRIKSEVYEGFSYVFGPDSSQDEVYEKMVSPLVEDFLKGKSGMLATLGSSGSGKTHTVFGCPRDPGILPRTLQRIFEPIVETASGSLRSFSISIFEIQSERGRGEKLFDLSPGGAELTMQKSTIKGLQEVIVSDVREAESLLAKAMLRRLTATTNANSQSSRSQCIINIRSAAKDFDGEDDYPASNAVLSIVDLAGAEREKKTGNQGARLLESNFINNTSMVFGLCLRSLLEHQKNPKRPLQKHFQNSLLTRYLRDYLEGKKRMALILTVKSGEEDYLDTTYLLRQASPFMRIRFDNVEEKSNIPCNKRQSQTMSRSEQPKRMKFSGLESCVIEEGKASEDEHHTPGQGCLKEEPRMVKSEISDCARLESNYVELAERERNYQIWQMFAKDCLNTLKLYKEKLKVAENEIQHLTENLELEKTRYVELDKKLEDSKSCCMCSHQKPVDISLLEAETNFKHSEKLNGLDCSDFFESNVDFCSSKFMPSESNYTPKKYDSTPRQEVISSQKEKKLVQTDTEVHSSSLKVSESKRTSESFDSDAERNQNIFSQVKEEDYPLESKGSECFDNEQVFDAPVTSLDVDVVHDSSLCVEISQQKYQIDPIFSGSGHNAEDLHESKCFETDDTCTNADVTELTVSSSESLVIRRKDSCSSVELGNLVCEEEQELFNQPESEDIVSTEGYTTVDVLVSDLRIEKLEESIEERANPKDCKADEGPSSEQRVDTPSKPEKPKRRLLPVSSALLRDFNTLEIEDKSEKSKGNRGGKKLFADERNKTQGSITLLRLLQSNIRV